MLRIWGAAGACAIAVLLLIGVGIHAQEEDPFIPLRGAVEPRFQAALERALLDAGLQALVKKKQIGVALAGITDTDCPRYAAVNGRQMMYAASLPKIAILLGALAQVEAGAIELDDDFRDQLTRMIRSSSNQAATAVMRRVGPQQIADTLQSPRFALYDSATGGGLWVGKEYAKGKAWRRDPMLGLSHAANALQVARLYYLLETGHLLGPELSQEMRAILSQPGITHKFVASIRSKHPTARFLRKSGTWRNWHADSGVISHDGKRYIAVVLVESLRGEEIIRDLILRMDRIVFEVPLDCPDAAGDAAPEPPDPAEQAQP